MSLLVLPGEVRAETHDDGPLDIFVGMVAADGEGLVLERCNLARTRYQLRPAEGAGDPLGELRGKGGQVQAQVIARYRAEGEAHVLDVAAVDGVQLGKTCHVLDAIDASFAAAKAEAETAAPVDEGRWEALTAGAAAPPETETIGSGAFAYRFILLHPRTGQPSPQTDFALSASRKVDFHLPFVTDEKNVFQGRTDAAGRTPVSQTQRAPHFTE